MLSAIFGTETAPAEDENHRMLSLQLRKLSMLRSVIGKFVIGKDRAGDNVRSHIPQSHSSYVTRHVSL